MVHFRGGLGSVTYHYSDYLDTPRAPEGHQGAQDCHQLQLLRSNLHAHGRSIPGYMDNVSSPSAHTLFATGCAPGRLPGQVQVAEILEYLETSPASWIL